jgi:hypothetical protein
LKYYSKNYKKNVFIIVSGRWIMTYLNVVKGKSLGNGNIEVVSTANIQPIKIKVKAEEVDNKVAEMKANDMVKDVQVGKTLPNGMVEISYVMKDVKPRRFSVPEAKADEFIASYQKNADSTVNFKKPALLGVGVGLLGGFGMSKLLSKMSKWFKIPMVAITTLGLAAITAGTTIARNVQNYNKKEENIAKQFGAQLIE